MGERNSDLEEELVKNMQSDKEVSFERVGGKILKSSVGC